MEHKELSALQLISFEVGSQCDLAKAHPYCPVNHRKPGAEPFTDDQAISFAKECRDWGFCGEVAYHYYSEPLLYQARMLGLAKRMKEEVGLNSLLWTNGTNLTDSVVEILIQYFQRIMITLHDSKQQNKFQKWVMQYEGKVHVKPGGHDDRGKIYTQQINGRRMKPCYRPTEGEMPIDYWGKVHLCCMDWDGQTEIGNIALDYHPNIIRNWVRHSQLATTATLFICRKCQNLGRSSYMPTTGHKF
jgi:hypothetical protein